MVDRCTISDNVKLVTQIVPQSVFELGASICSDCGGGPKTSYPPAEESIGNSFDFNVYQRYGFGPTREPIDAGQQIFINFRVWQRVDYVNMYVVEPLRGFSKLTEDQSYESIMM